MDSFGLRQEISELQKQYDALKHKLDIGEARIKELHDEEMTYLKEIPVFKLQSKEARLQALDAVNNTENLKKEILPIKEELLRVTVLVDKEKQALKELKETEDKIIKETKEINEQVKLRHEQLKQRELAVSDKEKASDLRELGCGKRESDVTDSEVKLDSRIKSHSDAENDLKLDIENHLSNVSEHSKKVDIFIQKKEIHLQDEQMLVVKQQRIDKLLKENVDLKNSLLLQADKLAKEITITQHKQLSLDKSIADLVNQENTLKIKELRVNKLIHDNGLAKELKELEESLK